jgi:uncharacterized protein
MTRPADIVSPCIDVCDVDSTGQYCIGCGRSMAEIAAWLAMTAAQRQVIMAELPARLQRLER